MPALEDPRDGLGPGLSAALARSADIAAEDAEALEAWAGAEFERLRSRPGMPGEPVLLPAEELAALPDAVRYRVIGRDALAVGAGRPSRERVLAVDRLVATRSTGGSSAGPVELAGGVVVHRRRADGYATLVFSAGGPPYPNRTGPDPGGIQ